MSDELPFEEILVRVVGLFQSFSENARLSALGTVASIILADVPPSKRDLWRKTLERQIQSQLDFRGPVTHVVLN